MMTKTPARMCGDSSGSVVAVPRSWRAPEEWSIDPTGYDAAMPPAVTLFTTFDVNMGFLDQTIRSVLGQTFTDFEYLIINDGDPAESERIARDYPDPRIRIVTIPHEILATKRQQGLELAQARYFAVIDSADVCEPERLAKQVAFLEAQSDHAVG